MKYTDEQLSAVQAFLERIPLKIKAFAGSGKTTVLRLMANRDGRRGLYLAYNREIANSSRRKFPRTVVCKTAHALAQSLLPKELLGKASPARALETGRVERVLRRRAALSSRLAGRIAPLAQEALHWYCVSADPTPALHHAQQAVEGKYLDIDPTDVLAVLPAVWDAMVLTNGALPLTFDAQLKLLQLAEKPLPFDYILADECQDMYPAIQSIIRNSAAQEIWVGDSNQQIYEFNGADDAMGQLNDLESYSLTMAFRFGEWLAELVQPLLAQLGEVDVICGNPNVETRRSTRSMPVRLARCNASLLVPLVKAVKANKSVCVLGGPDKLLALLNSAERVMRKHPVRSGLFAGLSSWPEARERAAQKGNRDLRDVVELIEEHRLREVRRCVEYVREREEDAQLILSTVHQAKGREFARVGLLDDFRRNPEYVVTYGGKDVYAPAPETLRLLYVALTRAERELFVPMALARRFRIEHELKRDEVRSRAPTTQTAEVPAEVPPAQIDRWPGYNAYSANSARLSHTTVTHNVTGHATSGGNSFWDRWGLRLLVTIGVCANLLLADYKGFIDLSVVMQKFGF